MTRNRPNRRGFFGAIAAALALPAFARAKAPVAATLKSDLKRQRDAVVAAMDQFDRGEGRPLEEVMAELRRGIEWSRRQRVRELAAESGIRILPGQSS